MTGLDRGKVGISTRWIRPRARARMSASSAHPERLLQAVDDALDHEVRLILYGRSAIWLGFNNPPAAAAERLLREMCNG